MAYAQSIKPLICMVLMVYSTCAYSVNWLKLQGTEQHSNTLKIWGFFQPTFQKDFSDSTGPEATRIGPNLETQEQFQLYRARVGIRGKTSKPDSQMNYFSLFEFGHNGSTDGASFGERTPVRMMDFSLTLNQIPYSRIRIGLFKTPGSEELLQGLPKLEYINFTWTASQLLLERYAKGVTNGNDDDSVNPDGSEYSRFDSSYGAGRDTGIQIFDWVKRGVWEHSYAVMLGNGNGLEPASGIAEGLERYFYWSSEKLLSKSKPMSGLKMFAWLQVGKRNFINTDSSVLPGPDKAETFKRKRQGVGLVYRNKPWRVLAEYSNGTGMILQGPEKPGFNIAAFNCLDGRARGYYMDAGYYIPDTKWNMELRYDNYLRCKGHKQIEANYFTSTLGVQYRFDKQTKATFNYEIRKAKATGEMPFANLKSGLKTIGNRLGIQITNRF